MSYDFDGCADKSPPQLPPTPPPHPKDLEYLVMLMQVAAIELSPKSDSTFTFEQMFAVMQGMDEAGIEEVDVRILLPFSSFLKKHPGKMFSLK